MSRSRSSSSSKRSRKSNKQQSNNRERRRQRSRSSEPRRQSNNENTCLYIGNLDKRCPEDKLKDICQKYGPFEYCYIVFEPSSYHDRSRDAKVSRGYGFVKYKSQADAQKARDELNGFEIMSRKITVQVSKRNRPRESTPGQYLGRRRSPPRDRSYRRRSYSRSSDGEYRRRRRRSDSRERRHRDRDRDRENKESKRRDRDRSRSGEKKHKKRRQSRSNSPRK